MDVFAHGFWAAAAARGANPKLRRKLRVGWAVWWGVFPDLFAFTIPVTLGIWNWLTGHTAMPQGPRGMPYMHLASQLYQVSHSLVVFAAVFGLTWLIARRPVLELLGWAMHILIDMPTHTTRFFATPFLWPISSYRVSGISWANRWFMLCNYTALAVVYILLWRRSAVKTGTSARPASAAPDSPELSSRR